MRPFYFSNINGRSVADDGGLIEVRVFRAKGRRKSLPTPAEFKPQDQYGLVYVSPCCVSLEILHIPNYCQDAKHRLNG